MIRLTAVLAVVISALVFAGQALAHSGEASITCPKGTNTYEANFTFESFSLSDGDVTLTVTDNGTQIASDVLPAFEGSASASLGGTLAPGTHELVADATWQTNGSFTEATVTCEVPKPPPPPHVITIKPKASIHGPCGEPFYWAVFNNKRSDRAVKFRFSFVAFSDGQRHRIVHRVGRHHKWTTPQVHVLGSSGPITVRARVHGHWKLLDKVQAAPPGNYIPCP